MGSEVVPTPADVMAKATRMLKRVMLLQMVWFLCFFRGRRRDGVDGLEEHAPARHVHERGAGHCVGDRELRAPLVPLAGALVLVGIAGLFVTGYVATRLAVKYLGAGAAAFLRSGRRFMGPMDRVRVARTWVGDSPARPEACRLVVMPAFHLAPRGRRRDPRLPDRGQDRRWSASGEQTGGSAPRDSAHRQISYIFRPPSASQP